MAAFGVEMPLSPRRAAATRDALARALYAALFEHVLQQANAWSGLGLGMIGLTLTPPYP